MKNAPTIDGRSLGRIPPHDLEAEQAVLGSLLLDQRVLGKLDFLSPDDFYRKNHEDILIAVRNLVLQGEPVDIVTVGAALDKMGVLDRVGGHSYLAQLEQAMPTSSNAEHYARIVREKSLKRQLVVFGSDLAGMGYDEAITGRIALGNAQATLIKLGENETADFIDGQQLMAETMAAIREAGKNPNGLQGIPSGFYDVDDITNGFRSEDLVIVAGRPSIGKTTMVLNIAAYNAIKRNMPVLIFSLEMGRRSLMEKMLSAETRIDSKNVHRGRLTDKQWEDIGAASGPMAAAPIFVSDVSYLDEMGLMLQSRHQKMVNKVGLIVVDFLQLMTGRGETEQQQVGAVASTLKRVAKELHVPVLAACQLNRAPDGRRDDHRPTLSDLRSSGQIEQVADTVLGLYNEGYYDREKPRTMAEVIFLKHRNGAVGDIVNLGFDAPSNRFHSLTKRQYTA